MKKLTILFGVGLAFIWLSAVMHNIRPGQHYDVAAGFSAAVALILAVAFAASEK